MKTLVLRIPCKLVRELEMEANERHLTLSEVVSRRLSAGYAQKPSEKIGFGMIADLVGSVAGLPDDLSHKSKNYLRNTAYGK